MVALTLKVSWNAKVEEGKAIGLQADVAKRLASKYGSNVDKLYNIAQIAQDKDLKLPLELYVELSI